MSKGVFFYSIRNFVLWSRFLKNEGFVAIMSLFWRVGTKKRFCMKAQGTLEEYGGGSMEKSIKFDVKVGVKELYFFLLHYNYASVNGAISLLLSLVSLGVFVFRLQYEWSTSNWFFLAIGLLFTVVQPVLLLKMAVTQKIKNPSMNDPLEYELREDGILLRQNDLSNEIRKIKIMDKSNGMQ